MLMPTAKAKAPTIVQTQQDQKGRSDKQSACSCQMQNVLNASEPKRTLQSKASMAVHLGAEAAWKAIRRGRAERQNVPNETQQKGRADAA